MTLTRHRRHPLAVMLLLALVAVPALVALPATPVEATESNVLATIRMEREFLTLLNAERKRAGLPALTMNLQLVRHARDWSATMRRNDRLYHDTRDPGTYLHVRNGSWTTHAENVGRAGSASTKVLHEAFMASAGHRSNILRADVTHVGIGVDHHPSQPMRTYVTVKFLRTTGGDMPLFRDHPTGATTARAVDALWLNKVMAGCNPPVNDRFCHQGTLTREQAAVMVAGALDLTGPSTIRYGDVPAASRRAVNAVDSIVTPCRASEARFCPATRIRRTALATYIRKARNLPTTTTNRFTDVTSNARNINAVADAGIIPGCATSPHRFCPNDYVSRGQAAIHLTRAFKLPHRH